ncbi:Retrovirus-related Pol poly from transposon 412 [Paramuricea clavata]|uniref:Retrovirus-related Pol poly from transposon 412, partial n=1 Tax=Paramuricea clavata TaxID=317549 RepID=A0A6S7IGU0_PARCT|nr:Retrovirus-related Pol poly from transposon 412 [Paramuricea clavata]
MADQRYLNVLAESYKNASSWETRKQILSIVTDLASYSELLNTDTRHPHLVQDLPFGQKHLTLSSGKILERKCNGSHGSRAFDELLVHLDNADEEKCNNKHLAVCKQCLALEETLKDVEGCFKAAEFPSVDERDDLHYTVRSAVLAINSWKCHILRSLKQDQARLDVLKLLDEKTVFIVNDWAMEFLPQGYRESQQDWFGKRGISWHISVVYRRQRRLLSLRDNNPVLPQHSERIWSEDTRLDFSDPQGGKGAADRLAATCKNHIRAYINEGNDVLTAKQLKEAIVSHGGINGLRVVSMESIGNTRECTEKIPSISKMNNYKVMSIDKIKVWRAYKLGKGKVIKTAKPPVDSNYNLLESTFSSAGFKTVSQEQGKTQHEKDHTAEKRTDGSSQNNIQAVYPCPHDGCVRMFQRLGNLENHLSTDKRTQTLEKDTLLDLAKMGYKSSLEDGAGVKPTLQASKAGHEGRNASPLAECWALRTSKKTYRFSEKQKDYLLAKFEIGESTAQDIRRVRDSDDERLFQASEFLSSQQITSYFSRLAAKRRKAAPTESDLIAIEEEIGFTRARTSAMESIGLEHPIVYSQYNVFAMIEKNTLKNLKLGMLQVVSEKLCLQVPRKQQEQKRQI